MGGSDAVCAKFSGTSAAAAWAALVASSLANLLWKAIDHCCLCARRVEGVNVAIDRGLATKALDGAALMARTAARRRRNLYHDISTLSSLWLECAATYMMAMWSGSLDSSKSVAIDFL
jgi:hypothetical protein